jgi:hypothetical protein
VLSRATDSIDPTDTVGWTAVGVLVLYAIKIRAEVGEVIKESRLIP